jgi:UDP-glucose:O-linked fucose beta-1,3-glucosyltransferase
MVFSAALVSKMMSSGHCNCPTPDTPDDMHLGACMSHLGVSVTHSARFHQARPEDYHDKLLRLQDPVSFHKFWNTDPRKIYAKWFEPSDRRLTELKFNTMHRHTEL